MERRLKSSPRDRRAGSSRPTHRESQVTGQESPEDFEHELLHRLRMREEDALRQLAQQYGAALMRAACLHLRDTHAAQDVVQDTLIAAWDRARRAQPGTRLRAWLFGILFNRCRKHQRSLVRRLRRERAVAKDIHTGQGGNEGPDERLELLRRALEQLDERSRAVIILRYDRGLSVSETAAALEVPEGTVRSRTHAGITRLREYMRTLS